MINFKHILQFPPSKADAVAVEGLEVNEDNAGIRQRTNEVTNLANANGDVIVRGPGNRRVT